ncbi:MAG: hypothetical protein ACLUNO_03245 [Oscillospiraceae bacterium]
MTIPDSVTSIGNECFL